MGESKMTIAEDILKKIEGASAVTLAYGYAMFVHEGNRRELFEPAKVEKERIGYASKSDRNKRVLYAEYRYSDGSGIRFTLHQGRKLSQYGLLPIVAPE
jgi:hypothetical protein